MALSMLGEVEAPVLLGCGGAASVPALLGATVMTLLLLLPPAGGVAVLTVSLPLPVMLPPRASLIKPGPSLVAVGERGGDGEGDADLDMAALAFDATSRGGDGDLDTSGEADLRGLPSGSPGGSLSERLPRVVVKGPEKSRLPDSHLGFGLRRALSVLRCSSLADLNASAANAPCSRSASRASSSAGWLPIWGGTGVSVATAVAVAVADDAGLLMGTCICSAGAWDPAVAGLMSGAAYVPAVWAS